MPDVMSTESKVDVEWSKTTDVPMQHYTLPETIDLVMEGIAQAQRGESVEIDPDELPTDDDPSHNG